MAMFLELDKAQLISFANGSTFNGHTLTTPGTGVIDSAPALEIVTSIANAWSLAAKVIGGSHEIYTLTHA